MNGPQKLSILYRGDLSSCNYACTYCPFAKTKNTREELLDDSEDLARFVDWVAANPRTIFSVLFTPWGEAMIRRHYQEAFIDLSAMPNVEKVAVQTNLSCVLDWTENCDTSKIALWCTFHPTQTTEETFLAKCEELRERGVPFSVGIVGLKENFDAIRRLRDELSDDVYVWVNAYKREKDYYAERDITFLETIDPLFSFNNQYHSSIGESCRTGESVISVDGDGNAKRCHFIETPLGNIYDESFFDALKPRACVNETCGCYIGYVHMDKLGLYDVYGPRVLERIR